MRKVNVTIPRRKNSENHAHRGIVNALRHEGQKWIKDISGDIFLGFRWDSEPDLDQGWSFVAMSGVKEKNFDNCSFKITLPRITVFDGVAKVNFKIMSQKGKESDVVLNEIYLVDKLERKYDKYYTGFCKLKEKAHKEFSVDVPIKGREFLAAQAYAFFYFLSSDGYRYEIGYSFNRESGEKLDYVMSSRLSQEEFDRIENNIEIEKKKTEHSIVLIEPDDPETIRIPEIEEYRKATLQEMTFLQNEGGRKYKLSNGQRISDSNGHYTYSFEMEAELYISDDAPISLNVGIDKASGTVLVCEGFQIIVIVDRDFGKQVGQALMSVEPWKLLEALAKKMEKASRNRLAMMIIRSGPKMATDDPAVKIPKGQMEAMNAVQRNDITVIWGPPGTGKTYTMAQIAKEALKKGKSVLAVSHSNVSVDGVVKQTVAILREEKMESLLHSGKVLRYGFVRDEVLSQDEYASAFNYALMKNPGIKHRMDRLSKQKNELIAKGNAFSRERDLIEKDLKALRAEVRNAEREYVRYANFVATTISKVTIDPLFEEMKFDLVMFDEVSMAYVPQIIGASMYSKEKVVLVGDFRQLPPIAQSGAKQVLETDIFSYLGMVKGSKVCAHPWLVMLNEQRRMHPLISAFPNKYIYGSLLVDHPSVSTSRQEVVGRNPFEGKAINLINLSGAYASAMKNSDNSRFNILSAIVSFQTAIEAERNGEKSVGIITPYAAQTRLIRAMIQDYRKANQTDIVCSTVHQFQGSERNLIIFDAVESYPASKVGWLMGKEVDSVNRLINVALTRAKGKLIIVSYVKFWEMKYGTSQHIFWNLLKYLMQSGNEISVKNKTLASYVAELPETKNIINYRDVDIAAEAFQKDAERAKQEIIISLPDGELDAETQGRILSIIDIAKKNNIRVLCKTKDYENLPEDWKRIAWASENAAFPMIVIDEKIAWYGLPKSRGCFRDKNSTFSTVVPTYYRVKGEHTIEMIRAFSGLDYREIDGQRKTFLEKSNNETIDPNDKGTGSGGLDAFVRKKEKCSVCKHPMMLARGKTGRFYLKCSSASCKEKALLTSDLTNWYIDVENVTCPIHRCGIHAAVGPYGIYIKCEQGHYIKPGEI
ncbi:AAA domain-containing protein [[Clostridium] aminophilum]|uniref:AAA domain-containing protein n=1 Tax=[Clostridium] aminophilum TaxID=1526 RepID=UPI00331CBA17